MGVVYHITNKLNNKVYIGSTTKPFRRRKSMHISTLNRNCHHNIHLQRSWNKYGHGAFEFGVLDEVVDPLELLRHEQTWLDLCRMDGSVYNIAKKVTNTTLGIKLTKEQRKRISDARSNGKHPMYGKHFSEEARRNMAATRKPMFGMANPMYSRHHSKETKKKIAACTARPYPAFINKLTGDIIPAGVNLKQTCRELSLGYEGMAQVKSGAFSSYRNWILLEDGV